MSGPVLFCPHADPAAVPALSRPDCPVIAATSPVFAAHSPVTAATPRAVARQLPSQPEPRQSLLDARQIARPEQPHMHERGVEIVEVAPDLVESGLERRQRLIGLEEG